LNAIDRNGGVKGESETENLEEESKGNARAPLKKAAEAEHHKISKNKCGGCSHGTLRIDERLNHRRLILTVNSRCNKQSGSQVARVSKKGLA
jgi:hypothetical protein